MKTIKSIKGFRILFLLILSTLAIFVISFSTLSESHSVPSFLTASNNTDHDRQSQASNNVVVVDVLRKIERELEKLRSETVASSSSSSPSTTYEGKGTELSALSRTHAAFLAEIKTDLESLLLLSTPTEGSSWAEDHRNHTSNNNIHHPLIPNPNQLKSSGADQAAAVEEYFLTEEIRKYIRIKPNRLKKQNFMGANGTFTSIGHACFSMKTELERYMDYDVGELCNDDWKLAQKLMVHGCDPLPRRRCFSRAPQLYTRPYSLDEESSMWRLPDDKNVRWSGYKCKNFSCLAKSSRTSKGFFKCADCFNLTHHESPRWVTTAPTTYVGVDPGTNNLTSDFTIAEVLEFKPDGSIRIGLDFSVGTGTFAARMKEYNVTIVSATINLGAPFNEMIALRGLVPLYLTVNQRLPFFDNTLDLIHTTRFLDGWIDYMLLDFILYDWDRALRVGGLIWIDGFFCLKEDLDDYLDGFMMLRYKVHKWVVVPKLDKGDLREVSFSALLEKPPRPF